MSSCGPNFSELRQRLLEYVRLRLQSGEFTERYLARLAGLSQSHLHNALKGARRLSDQSADLLLRCLRITVLDLLTPQERGPSPQPGRRPPARGQL